MLMNKPAMATDQSLRATFMFSYDVSVLTPVTSWLFIFLGKAKNVSRLVTPGADCKQHNWRKYMSNKWATGWKILRIFTALRQQSSNKTNNCCCFCFAAKYIGHPSTQLIIIFHRQSQAFYLHLPQTLPPAELLIHLTLWYLWYKDQLF